MKLPFLQLSSILLIWSNIKTRLRYTIICFFIFIWRPDGPNNMETAKAFGYDLLDNELEVIYAPYDGIIIGFRTVPRIRPGDWTVWGGRIIG